MGYKATNHGCCGEKQEEASIMRRQLTFIMQEL